MIAVVFFIALGWGTHLTVENAMKDILMAKLQTILEADITALNIWLDMQKKSVDAVVAEPEVKENNRELVALAREHGMDVSVLRASKPLKKLREMLGPLCRAYGYVGFLIIDPDGFNLGAFLDEYVGEKTMSDQSDFITKVLSGKTTVSKPFRAALAIPDEKGLLRTGRPTMLVAAPVRDEQGLIISVLALLIQPERDFTRILMVARPGKSGETYAFDSNGLMISNSRFNEHLKQIGLLGDKPDIQAILNVEIRNPGGNMVEGFRPRPRSKQPLTLMAANAVSGKDGVNVNGYRDYRGVPVIGAWKWLHEYGFGVTTEEDVSEAFRPLKILRDAFGFLFVLLILTVLVVMFSVRIIASQQRKMQRLGQYRLERKLGRGGLGEVYKASHAMLRRPTAIKLLRPERSSKEEMERFEREVQLTSQLTHLNTIRIYDYGRTPEGVFYYAMEYLPGINLHDFIEEAGPVTEGRCIHILLQVCASLKEAHAFGLIHRDIKPENIIIYERGGDYDMVKVLDFGLVKYARDTQKAGVSRYEWVAGTPQYLSPEAIKTPAEIDGRSDLYSVGAVAYYLLTGSDVFGGITPTDICRKQVHDAPQSPSERLGRPISDDLESVVLSCLEKDPERRPKDASVLIEALEKCRDAGIWTQAEAKDWWIRHGKKMVDENLSSEIMPPISESKISIDLKQRERK